MLTVSEVDEFHNQGFLFVDHPVLSVADVLGARQVLDALFETWLQLPRRFAPGADPLNATHPTVSEIKWPMALAPELARIGLVADCRAVASELLALKRVWCHFDHAIYKSPGSEAVGWHQDRALSPTGLLERAVHFWIPLHDVAPDRGGMMFVPLSQVSEVLPHELAERSNGVKTKAVRPETAIVGITKALPLGGFSIHGPRTLHSSAANNGADVRKAWILQFGVGPWAAVRHFSIRPLSFGLGLWHAN
jgi:hypothetical protein